MSFFFNLIISPIINILEVSFKIIQEISGSNGISILGLSILVTLFCLPLYIVAEFWSQIERDIQKKIKPGIERIKQTFKGDEQYMMLTTFYKQNHYHPMMALRSSFSLLIQIPFFIAAYNYLSHLELLNGSSFWFINNLGQPDRMFNISGLSINILPVLMTLINCIAGVIYSKVTPKVKKFKFLHVHWFFLFCFTTLQQGLYFTGQ